VLQIKLFAQDWFLEILVFVTGQHHVSVKMSQNAQQLLLKDFVLCLVALLPIVNVLHQHVQELQPKQHAHTFKQMLWDHIKFVLGPIMLVLMQLILQL
jgi:hypothetical protein